MDRAGDPAVRARVLVVPVDSAADRMVSRSWPALDPWPGREGGDEVLLARRVARRDVLGASHPASLFGEGRARREPPAPGPERLWELCLLSRRQSAVELRGVSRRFEAWLSRAVAGAEGHVIDLLAQRVDRFERWCRRSACSDRGLPPAGLHVVDHAAHRDLHTHGMQKVGGPDLQIQVPLTEDPLEIGDMLLRAAWCVALQGAEHASGLPACSRSGRRSLVLTELCTEGGADFRDGPVARMELRIDPGAQDRQCRRRYFHEPAG
jgi:hypothetical protein